MNFNEVFEGLDATVFYKKKRHLKDIEVAILRGTWQGQKYDEIAKYYGYSAEYFKQDIGPKLWKLLSEILGEKVSKTNFKTAVERRAPSFCKSIPPTRLKESIAPSDAIAFRHQDWGEAIDVSIFSDRSAELATLERWIVTDRCRVVAIVGMGGIGKTALSVKLAQQIQNQFEYIIWRSLRNAPPLDEILAEIIKFLSKGQYINLPKDENAKISRLVERLRSARCLLVLDNVEAILRGGDRAGYYLEGYEGYGELIQRLGEVAHQSFLVLTSREKLEVIASFEGENFPVRSLQLTGLNEEAGAEILKAKGLFGSEEERKKLLQFYRGNPLVLKIISSSIKNLFCGNIGKYLSEGTTIVKGVRELLDWHFERLSDLEKRIMYWLAIEGKPVSLSQLQSNIVPSVSKLKFLEAVESLLRRSLLEHSEAGLIPQPLAIEYINEFLIKPIGEAIANKELKLLISHDPPKATVKDYVTESLVPVILTSVA